MTKLLRASVVGLALLLPGASASAQQLVGSGAQTFSPTLAVSNGGNMIATWFQGPGPCVSAAACDSNWTGSAVTIDAGSTRHGFGRPVVVAHNGNDEDGAAQVAESGTGVGYVAWQDETGGRAQIVTVRRGVESSARTFLPKNVNQVELLSSSGGPAAAVWSQYGHGFPIVRYGLLDRTGRVSRVVTILHTNASIGEDMAYSLGARGRLVVGWTAGDKTEMTTCDPGHGCAAAQSVVSTGLYGSVAVALSADGTVTAAAGGGPGGAGVFAATERFGGHLSKAVRLNVGGRQPTAAPVGSGGALVMFEPGSVPYSRLAWSMLGPAGFGPPVVLGDTDALGSAAVAGNLRGQFAAAWIDSVRPSGPDTIRLALGAGGIFGQPRTIVPATELLEGVPPPIGIDGAGNAVVLWNRWCGGGSCGMFASVVRR